MNKKCVNSFMSFSLFKRTNNMSKACAILNTLYIEIYTFEVKTKCYKLKLSLKHIAI